MLNSNPVKNVPCLERAPAANGLKTGQYMAPTTDFILPENVFPGSPPPPNNFWNLGFLAETERQVEGHLEGHLERLPPTDSKSRAIVMQMQIDEGRHARTALQHGGAELPAPVKLAMKLGSRAMTLSSHWV